MPVAVSDIVMVWVPVTLANCVTVPVAVLVIPGVYPDVSVAVFVTVTLEVTGFWVGLKLVVAWVLVLVPVHEPVE